MSLNTTGNMSDFILASASPRRRELLQQIGCRFYVSPEDIDESVVAGESAEAYVSRMALQKARAGWLRQRDGCSVGNAALPVLGADTSVVVDGEVLGKPRDQEHAVSMLLQLSANDHRVLSSVAMVNGETEYTLLSDTRVRFRELTRAECEQYWHTGEPCDKAGAYAIQGFGAVFVEYMSGSYSGVVGLPLAETCKLLKMFGLSWWGE
jgi:septum formation protein